jgi:trimeric autotransporter adhesin
MAVNFSSGMIGLSVLTGNTSVFGLMSGLQFESAAVRRAKAQFTAPPTIAPWQQKPSRLPESSQIAAIQRMATIIDTPTAKEAKLPADVQTTFLAYKALDRLRLLAEAGAAKTTSDATRGLLQAAFGRGLEDLQSFLAETPTDRVRLAFGETARRAESVKAAATFTDRTLGTGLLATRTEPLQGITGTETLEIKLTKYGITDTVTVNLATTPQPPTLDSVTQALNAAIATVPMLRADGTVATDTSGNPLPKYNAKFLVEKSGDKWGMVLSAPI